MKNRKFIKIGLIIFVISIAFIKNIQAQIIVPASNREPGVCYKTDSLGHSYQVIYTIPKEVPAEPAAPVKATPEILDTFWVNKKEVHIPARIQQKKKTTQPSEIQEQQPIESPQQKHQ